MENMGKKWGRNGYLGFMTTPFQVEGVGEEVLFYRLGRGGGYSNSYL